VAAMWIVPAFNEVEDRERGFPLRLKSVACEKLAFESRIEALAHRVIVAVANRSHRRRDAGFLQRLSKAIDVYCDP